MNALSPRFRAPKAFMRDPTPGIPMPRPSHTARPHATTHTARPPRHHPHHLPHATTHPTAPPTPRHRPPPPTRYPGTVKTFDDLFAELSAKAVERPEGSGTVAQLDAGVHAIGKKIVEEAAEVWMAAEYESDAAAAEEISQLLYHLQTLMLAKGLSLEDVYRHL